MCLAACGRMTRAWVVSIVIFAAGCGGSGSNPADPSASRMLEGQVLSAVDGSAIGALNVRVGIHNVKTDPGGNFQVDVGSPGSFDAIVTGTGAIERHTTVTGPASERVKIT